MNRRNVMKKDNKIEKVLLSIAKATSSSTSLMLLYEPKVPEKLLNKRTTDK